MLERDEVGEETGLLANIDADIKVFFFWGQGMYPPSASDLSSRNRKSPQTLFTRLWFLSNANLWMKTTFVSADRRPNPLKTLYLALFKGQSYWHLSASRDYICSRISTAITPQNLHAFNNINFRSRFVFWHLDVDWILSYRISTLWISAVCWPILDQCTS